MTQTPEPRTALPSRRTIARGAAWAVPVVAVTAAAPAFAASGGTALVQGSCAGAGAGGSFSVSVTGTAATYVQVQFTHSGDGSIGSITAPADALSCGLNCYLLPVTGGSAGGSFTVDQTLPRNGVGTVTATISSSPGGQIISGDTTGFFTKRRDGNSSNYVCEGTG